MPAQLPVRPLVAALLGALAAGCAATIPIPRDDWAVAQADIGRAEASGAPSVPDARLHLQLAREDLSRSKLLFEKDNYRAASLIVLARAEAELALSLAKEAASKDDEHRAEAELAKANGK